MSKKDLHAEEERCFIATQRFLRRGGVESPAGWCMHAAVAMRECLTRAGVDAELVARKLPRGAGGHWTVKTPSGELDPTIGFWSARPDSLYQIPARPADAAPGQLYRVGKGSPQRRWRRVSENTARAYACVLPRIRPRKQLAAPPLLEPMIQAKERELVKWKQERGVLFDKHGRIVLQKKGTKHKLSFDEDDVALFPDRYLTHNHPGVNFSTFESGSSLSPLDVYVAAKRNLAEVRAVTRISVDGQQKTIVYRIERPAGGWPESWRIKDEAEATSARLKWTIEKEWRAGKRTYEQTATAVMHETWLEVAPKLGLKYSWTVLDGAQLGRTGRRRRKRRVHSR